MQKNFEQEQETELSLDRVVSDLQDALEGLESGMSSALNSFMDFMSSMSLPVSVKLGQSQAERSGGAEGAVAARGVEEEKKEPVVVLPEDFAAFSSKMFVYSMLVAGVKAGTSLVFFLMSSTMFTATALSAAYLLGTDEVRDKIKEYTARFFGSTQDVIAGAVKQVQSIPAAMRNVRECISSLFMLSSGKLKNGQQTAESNIEQALSLSRSSMLSVAAGAYVLTSSPFLVGSAMCLAGLSGMALSKIGSESTKETMRNTYALAKANSRELIPAAICFAGVMLNRSVLALILAPVIHLVSPLLQSDKPQVQVPQQDRKQAQVRNVANMGVGGDVNNDPQQAVQSK